MNNFVAYSKPATRSRHSTFASALTLIAAAMAPQSAHAQAPTGGDIVVSDPVVPDTITVLATGTAEPLRDTGQAISVITGAEIQTIQGPDFTRIAQTFPSLNIARNGGIGSATSLFVRGADSQQLLVLIDGVRVADVSAPSGGYDFGGLVSGGIGKVELLRGSNSVVWGSDAVGGVMAITSPAQNGGHVTLEYGAHNALTAEAGLGIERSAYGATLNAGYDRTDGIPTLATDTAANGFRQWHIGGNGRLALGGNLDLVAVARYADSRVGIDSYDPSFSFLGHFGDTQTGRQASGRIGLAYHIARLTLNAGIALSDLRRAYVDPPSGTLTPDYTTAGRSTRADVSGHLALPDQFALDFGADDEWTSFSDTYDPKSTARLASGHALLGYYGGRLNIAGGVRVDSHSGFGTHWTFGANGAFEVADGLRLRASYGEGFKAPSLYQLNAQFNGNPLLKPETSRSYDLGIEHGTAGGPLHASLTWFHRDTRNLIIYVDCFTRVTAGCAAQPFGYYDNIGAARAQGVELEGDARPVHSLSLRAAASWLMTRNVTPGDADYGKDLARRPRWLLSASGDWTIAGQGPLSGMTVGGDIRSSGASWDDAGNMVRLAPYTVVGARVSLPLADHLTLYARIENLGDVHYQTAAGYNSYGRSVYAGIRARL